MNNPLNYVGPDGKAADVYINGEDANEETEELQKEATNLKLTRDEKNGKLTYEGNAKTNLEKALFKTIDDHNVDVNFTTTRGNVIGGAYFLLVLSMKVNMRMSKLLHSKLLIYIMQKYMNKLMEAQYDTANRMKL